LESIRAKITLGIVALLLIMTIVTTAVAMERSEDALRNQITLTHEARATNAAHEIERALDRAKSITRATAIENEMVRPIEQDDLENGTVAEGRLPIKRLMLEHAHHSDDLFHGALVLDRTGSILMGEPFALQQEIDQDIQDPFTADRFRRLAEFTAEVPSPVVHAGSADEVWTVSARLMQGNEVWGVLVLVASTQALAELLGTTDGDTAFFILDHTGTVLIGPAGFPPGTDLSDSVERLQGAPRQSAVFEHEDRRYLATLAPLGDDWRLIIAQDSKVAFAPVDAMLATILLVSGIVIVIGVATGLFVAGRITSPVVRLKNAAERVAAGEYGTQVRTTAKKDELAELAAAFNTMSARLLEEHERLRRHQANLQTTVQERTAELKEANEELEAFVYAASHDLRTPLITLDWLMEELEAAIEQDDTKTLQDSLTRMRNNVEGMDRLILDLLELSRIGRTEGDPEDIMLRPAIENVLETIDHQRQKRGTQIHIEFDDSAVVQADPRRIEQVFQNLLTNAIKYGRANGNVHVRATPIGDPHKPWKWRIEVSDDGPGVPPEHREAIFQLFRRGPQAEEDQADGTGIGLAIVRKIIRSYGGEIKVTSSGDGGALFWFTLNAARIGAPAARSRRETDKSRPETEKSPQGSSDPSAPQAGSTDQAPDSPPAAAAPTGVPPTERASGNA
jgi:signal transduction histidine kinase